MSSKLTQDKLFFVGGAPRSGTTLVQRILGAHSEVYAGPEFGLVSQIMELRTQFLQRIITGRISTYLDMQDTNEIFEQFILSMFQKKADETKKPYLSEKTPPNIEVFSELQDCMPQAKYIFVVRDPRAVVASLLEVGQKMQADSTPAPLHLRKTRHAVGLVNAMWEKGNKALLRGDNVLLVHYEDIISAPESAIKRLTDFLGISFEESMLRIQDSKSDTSEFKAGEAYWYSKEQLNMAIDSQSVEKWKASLSAYDLYLIDRVLKRIPGITDRYSIEVSGSLLWGAANFAEKLLVRLKMLIAKVARLVVRWLPF
jgi:hypothetical protein